VRTCAVGHSVRADYRNIGTISSLLEPRFAPGSPARQEMRRSRPAVVSYSFEPRQTRILEVGLLACSSHVISFYFTVPSTTKLLATLLASGKAFLMGTAVLLALTVIRAYFNTTVTGIQWDIERPTAIL
jgi:hypothetical protein